MANTVIENEKKLEVLLSCDVVVVGGGPAGIAAAAGAAKAGVSVVIVERYSCLGGNVTVSSVEPPSWYRQEKTTMPGGVAKEIEDRMIALDAVQPCIIKPSTGLSYDTEMYKYMADCYIREYGITPVYHCTGTVPYMEGNTVKGVIVESKSGRQVILAKRVVDGSGDADMVYRSGAPTLKGDPETGKVGGGTLKFFLTGVDVDKLEAAMDAIPGSRDPSRNIRLRGPFERAIEAGEPELKYSLGRLFYSPVGKNAINVNLATFDREVDGTDVMSLTASEIRLRKEVLEIIRRLRKFGADVGFAGAKLSYYAMAVGIRETRRIAGGYTLTFDDIMNRGRFPDTIGVFPVYADGDNIKEIPYTDAYFQAPYRILVPQKVENLLAAGRCISGERKAVPTTRQMDFCMVTGQAAGAASALSVKAGVFSREVNIAALQKELERQGLRIF